MTLPFEVPDAKFKKTLGTLAGDEGVVATSAEALATPHRVRRDNVGFRGREPSILSHTNLPILMLNAS